MNVPFFLHRALRRALKWIGVQSHPSREELQRFVLGDLSPAGTSRVLKHLVPGCDRCRAVTAELWSIGAPPEEGTVDYQPVLDRAFSVARRARAELESGRCEAERLSAELEGLPPERRREAALSDPRYRNWALCELLLERSHGEAAGPERAEVAVAVAQGLAGERSLVAEDLLARAWGVLADVRRLAADLAGAEQALRSAREHLAGGTGCRLGKARLLAIEAALREAQGRSGEAARLGRRSLALYRRAGDDRAVTRQSPATIKTNPNPSIQPSRSPRKATASAAATSGCKVL
jgi:hypothetical protein